MSPKKSPKDFNNNNYIKEGINKSGININDYFNKN